MPEISMLDLIFAKRNGRELSQFQIQSFVNEFTKKGGFSEAQIGAFLMAVYLKGITQNETISLTKAMTHSGFVFDWPIEWKGKVVDKHSTGGIGDKTSLILAPALAACGLKVPMISGRGLGLTGGTLDKLESIPGYNVYLNSSQIVKILDNVGCCIVGQTEDLVPADKHIYRLRDMTSTVDNENLIVASIISKKAAENLDALVLDVKVGSGAMMKNMDDARSLAQNLVSTGRSFGMSVVGLITNMEVPLGRAVGNALEIAESIETLRNNGPSDLHELVLILGGVLLKSTGVCRDLEEGKNLISQMISSGEALSKFEQMLVGQGVDCQIASELCHGNYWNILPRASQTTLIKANRSGYIDCIDGMMIGEVSHGLGCGRSSPSSPIKYEPGVILLKKPGDYVGLNEDILEIHHEKSDILQLIKIQHGIKITDTLPKEPTLVFETLE